MKRVTATTTTTKRTAARKGYSVGAKAPRTRRYTGRKAHAAIKAALVIYGD